MDIESLKSALTARRGAIAAAAIAVASVGAVAWAVSSGPLVPASPAGGSAAGSAAGATAPAAAGSSMPEAPGGAPDGGGAADGDAGQQGDEEQQGAGTPSPADDGAEKGDGADEPGEPSGGRESEPKPQHHASAPDPGKPGKPAPQKPSPAPAPEPERPSRPAHTHSWSAVYRDEPVYGQQWVSKWEDVYTRHERYRCTTCGATYYSLGEMNAHLDSTIDWDAMTGHAGYLDDSYTTVEKVDKGSSQTVQTGTKKVLDHYECACGARK